MDAIEIRIARTVDFDALYAKAARKMLGRVMLAVHKSASQAGVVPIDTGNLRNSLAPGGGVTEVDKSDPPTWARVGTNVAYASYLDRPQSRTPRYRGGPSAGQETAGWLSERAVQGADADVRDAVARMAADITGGWKRGD